MSRPRAFVLGGGVAGLVAAFGLADRGYRVQLLESRGRCGGRAFSTPDRVFGRDLDNGCHVMLGCYRATRALLRRLGTERCFQQDRRLTMSYRFAGGDVTGLRLAPAPVPLAMPLALLRLGIPWRSRLRALLGMATVVFGARDGESFADWLRRRGQIGVPDDVMWRPLCRAVMNCEPEQAGAAAFLTTLREAFFGAASSAAFWIPRVGWSELLAAPAPAALQSAGVELVVAARVERLVVRDSRVVAIEASGGRSEVVTDDDLVVSALPWFALAKVLREGGGGDELVDRIAGLESAPIVTAYCEWPTGPGAPPPPADDGPVVAMVGAAPFHFLLRTPGEAVHRFALLSGGDRSLDHCSIAEIAATARAQLRQYYGVDADERMQVRVRKEQHATFVAAPGSDGLRPPPGRLVGGPDNLLVCGDWTRTGLPATLEGAARSAERMVATLAL